MEAFTEAVREKSYKDSRILISIGSSNLKLSDFLYIINSMNYTLFATDAINFYTTK